jgi:hypothetical protein
LLILGMVRHITMRLFYTELWGSGNVSVLGAERLFKFHHQYAMKKRNESASKTKHFAAAPPPRPVQY